MEDEVSLGQKAFELQDRKETLSTVYDDIKNETKLLKDEDPLVPTGSAATNPRSIHYKPKTEAEKTSFNNLITEELALRGLPLTGRSKARKARLRRMLETEQSIRKLLNQLEHGKDQDSALFLLLQAIPCILHMENHVALKIFCMLLILGLSNAKAGIIFTDVTSESERILRFIDEVSSVVNRVILGDDRNPANWRVPIDNENMRNQMKEIGDITMSNVKTRQVMENLKEMIEICIPQQEQKDDWYYILPQINRAFVISRKKEDFTDADIVEFQKNVDEFFQVWVRMFGKGAITNYIHMLSAGHVSQYMTKWRNLFRYSQQGWESLNSLLKTFYFCRTQRGGTTGRGKGDKTKLLPIGRWLQRRLLWLCGHDRESIKSFLEENEIDATGLLVGGDDKLDLSKVL